MRPPVFKRLLIRLAAWALAAAYIAIVGWHLAQGYAAAARGDAPLYTDYTSLYAASLLVRDAPAEDLYRPREMYRATVDTAYRMYGDGITPAQAEAVTFAPWMYPPTFIPFAMPLAHLPYLTSFLAWLSVTMLPLVLTLRLILPRGGALALSLAAPPSLFNIAYGQTGFLSGGLIGLGLAQLASRPLLAGACIGLASVKPHLGLLIPIALAAGGHWRVFASAAATVIALIVASILLLGIDPWYGFIGSMWFYLDGFDAGAYTWSSMTSVLATAYLAGAPIDVAFRLQYIAAALMATLVAMVWYRARKSPSQRGLCAAVLCFAAPLAVPMVYLYDLVVIVPGLAWLAQDMTRRGATRWEWATVFTAPAGLLATFLVAAYAGIQIGALCVAALLGLTLHRLRAAPSKTDPNQA